MNKRGGLVLSVIILAVVFVIGAVVGGPLYLAVAQSPGGFSDALVNAHECTRDETCETNSIKVGQVTGTENSTGRLFVQYDAYINDRAFIDRVLARQLNGEFLNINEEEDPGNWVFIFPDSISAAYLINEGAGTENNTGYACIDNTGRIFKSLTPCV